MTSPLWEVPLQVIAVLDELGVPYHVGGSFASSIHGMARQTRDLDLVAELSPADIAPFAARLQGGFYLDEDSIRRAIRDRSHFNLIHLASGFKVDLFVPGGSPFDRSEMARAAPYSLGDTLPRSVRVKSPEDIFLRKLVWYRQGGEVSDRQWNDLLGLARTQAGRLDLAYLESWAEALGVADLLSLVMEP
jgi:hypothetical protein